MHRVLAAAVAPLRLALDFALPPRCPGCGMVTPADHLFCRACWGTLDHLAGPACRLCGEPFPLDPGAPAACGACLAEPPAIDGMTAAVAYGDVAARLAVRLKHGRRPGLARTLALQMRRLVPADDTPLVVPVPLHRWRLWRRGYNQSLLIARALGKATGLEVAPDLLRRHKATPMLRGLGPTARHKTVRGAFSLAPGAAQRIAGQKILLVDDVYTTGATANACAALLKRAGASEVRLCCWARVVRDIDNAPAR